MNCITLTLNPAFDKYCYVKKLTFGQEHLADKEKSYAGGKGINISRALMSVGTTSHAVVVLGSENKDSFCTSLDLDNVKYTPIITEGKIRENLTVRSENGCETRISFKGFECDNSQLGKVYDVIENKIGKDTILTFTGSVPSGISIEEINSLLRKVSDRGCKIVIDSKSFKTLKEIVNIKPWLIKPNQEEISEYLGKDIKNHEEVLEVAKALNSNGIENVMISLGEKGAILATEGKVYMGIPPEIEAISTVGAGDSSIAGFISAYIQGNSAYDALKTSVAFGTASCLREGTLPPLPSDIEKIRKKVQINILT